ncbi:MAG: isochorismatase family protein [Leptospiraceae bacterium]
MKGVLITQCLQNDFVQPLDRFDPLPNQLHVGYEESRRLLLGQLEDDPVRLMIDWAYQIPQQSLEIIHIRDWHDPEDPAQAIHLNQFGSHCVQNTPGAEFVFQDRMRNDRPHHILNATGLNDFEDTSIASVLDNLGQENVRVGLMGVWTEAKVYFLAYELATRYPQFQIAVCSALCASSSRSMHFYALDQIRNILGLQVISSPASFAEFLTGKTPDLIRSENARIDGSRLHWKGQANATDTDKRLLLYLFRNSKEVELAVLDGGYSGNLVLGARATDHMGHSQVPLVAKIGPRDMIARERASFERIQEVLGNSAPAIVDSCELEDRGAILYRYASMLEGNVRTFQDFFTAESESPAEPPALLEEVLDTIFEKQLGRLYAAGEPETLNLLEYYDFSARYATGVRNRVLAIEPEATGDTVTIAGKTVKNPATFYEQDLNHLRENPGSRAQSFLHGDLNGRNIILDSRDNVWLIDFFHTHRGHILRDLIKLENDLLFIMTPVESEEDLKEALELADMQINHPDLGMAPDPELAHRFKRPQFKKAWKTICLLRKHYRNLIGSDRDPYQFHVAFLRYAVHTLSFDECNTWQKKWALYSSGLLTQRIVDSIENAQRLRLDPVTIAEGPPVYLTILPGRKDRLRDLKKDLETIRNENVKGVMCLVTPDELEYYGVTHLMSAYKEAGLDSLAFPILDQHAPSAEGLLDALAWLEDQRGKDHPVLIHCVGGLGRSGLVVAAYLMQKGLDLQEAVETVRLARSQRAIETREQMDFLKKIESTIRNRPEAGV